MNLKGEDTAVRGMSPNTKATIAAAITGAITLGLLLKCAVLFLTPCSSGFQYGLLIAVYPYVALMASFEIHFPILVISAALIQYPAYGFFLGRAWIKRRPLAVLIVPAVHVIVAIAAAIAFRNELQR